MNPLQMMKKLKRMIGELAGEDALLEASRATVEQFKVGDQISEKQYLVYYVTSFIKIDWAEYFKAVGNPPKEISEDFMEFYAQKMCKHILKFLESDGVNNSTVEMDILDEAVREYYHGKFGFKEEKRP